MYDISLLNWRLKTLASNSGKVLHYAAFGKSLPSSLPFSVNEDHLRQNSY